MKKIRDLYCAHNAGCWKKTDLLVTLNDLVNEEAILSKYLNIQRLIIVKGFVKVL